MTRAMQAHQRGDLDAAELLYRKVLRLQPTHPDALHYLGVLSHQRGCSDEAVKLISDALRITPKHPDAHNNLGNIHKECGRLKEAEACYRRTLECDPQHHNALSNLAVVLEALERLDEAFEVYTTLLKQAPEFAHGFYMTGLFLRNHAQNVQHTEQAALCLRRAFQLDSRNVRALEALGVTLYSLDRAVDAVAVYREWLVREPDNPVPRHMLAACGAEQAPVRADDAYVRETFDRFADSFDEQLLKNLDYRAPQLLADALAAVLPTPTEELDVLDAGCGTGLCGPLLKPYACRLTGVDLSAGMLAKARQRNVYDSLEEAELTAYLTTHRGCFDVVIFADTLVYFGDLLAVVTAAHASLCADGWLAFTVEALETEEDRVVLAPSGRYQHSLSHVNRILHALGFSDVSIAGAVLRKEGGNHVPGWVVRARRSNRPGR